MSFTLTCSGPVTVDTDFKPICVDGWIVEEVTAARMSLSDFQDLWPEIILLFVLAFGIKILLRTFDQNASRN